MSGMARRVQGMHWKLTDIRRIRFPAPGRGQYTPSITFNQLVMEYLVLPATERISLRLDKDYSS
jgi:hypothetical protein